MKHLRHLALCLLLVLTMATSAFAAEVPENLVVENLNGQQRIVKTYVLSPETDPDTLKEPPMFRYLANQLSAYRSRTLGVTIQPDGTATDADLTAEQEQWFQNHWLLQYDLMFGEEYALARPAG